MGPPETENLQYRNGYGQQDKTTTYRMEKISSPTPNRTGGAVLQNIQKKLKKLIIKKIINPIKNGVQI